MLRVEDLHTAYGPVRALDGVSFEVAQGSITAVLGANGAGKTSLLRTLSGLVRARAGHISLDGRNIGRLAVEQIVRLGMAHVPEGRGVIGELSVEENLRVGAYRRRDGRAVRADVERCFEYFPRLGERRGQRAGNLSGGEQQMLAISRGLMLRPRLLLLDEPSLGLAPVITRELFKILGTIARDEGVTVLLVEQNAKLALGLADYAYVLEAGTIALSGEAERLQREEAVQDAYLGL